MVLVDQYRLIIHSAILGLVAYHVALDRGCDVGTQRSIVGVDDAIDKCLDNIKVSTRVERRVAKFCEVEYLLLIIAESSHAQSGLVAVNLAVRHLDVCAAEVVVRKGIYRKRNGSLILQLHIYHLMIHHIVVAVIDATTKCATTQLLVDNIVDGHTLRYIEVTNPLLASLIEIYSREGARTLNLTVDTTLGATLGGILLAEPTQRAE